MTTKRSGPAPGVRLIEASVKRELTVTMKQCLEEQRSVADLGGGGSEGAAPSLFWVKKNNKRPKGEKPAGQVNQNRPPP